MKDLTIKCLVDSDLPLFLELIRLFEEVFEMENFAMPPETHLQQLLRKPGFMAFVAQKNGAVVGGLTAYVLDQYYSLKPLAYIYDLAVAVPLQRQGIGKALIEAINQHCREQGFEEIFVQADRVDDYALSFYRSTRPTGEEDVLHFTYGLEG
ncbi:MAG: GNAT family N-acetyltransferase [Bacteroidia bacterium]